MSKAMRSQILFWTLLILLVVLFILWQWGPVHSFAWKYDEGINVSKAQLLLDRHHLYEDIWSDQPPLFTFMLATTFLLFGESVAVGRLMVLALAGLALLSLAWIAEQVAGKVAALLAAVALALFPHFQELSQLIMIGLPAISLGLLALAFGFRYRAKGRMRWLLFAGLSFGLSLLVKPITAPMFLPLSMLSFGIWEERLPLHKRIPPWTFFAAATLLPVMVALICCSPRAFVQQVAGTLFGARRAHNLSLIENVRQIGIYLSRDKWELSHAGLSILALLGMTSLVLHRRWHPLAILGTWLGGVLGALVLHTPLRRHQLFLVVPPLLTTASLSIQQLVEGIPDIADMPLKEQLLMAIIAATLLPIGRNLPQTVTADIAIRETLLAEDDESRAGREAIRFLLAHTPTQGHVITDDPMIAFKANRPIPPSLAVPSARRIETQELSSKEMIRLTKDVDPSAILFWEQRLTRLEEYATWVRENFYTAHAYADDR
ncbi:MAG: glycosyltransferase family 39 protein, partial [Anaerolineae bacterium]